MVAGGAGLAAIRNQLRIEEESYHDYIIENLDEIIQGGKEIALWQFNPVPEDAVFPKRASTLINKIIDLGWEYKGPGESGADYLERVHEHARYYLGDANTLIAVLDPIELHFKVEYGEPFTQKEEVVLFQPVYTGLDKITAEMDVTSNVVKLEYRGYHIRSFGEMIQILQKDFLKSTRQHNVVIKPDRIEYNW